MFGSTELIIILVIGVLLFGASAIPRLAKSIGQARKEFEKGMDTEASSSKEKTQDGDKTKTLPKMDKTKK